MTTRPYLIRWGFLLRQYAGGNTPAAIAHNDRTTQISRAFGSSKESVYLVSYFAFKTLNCLRIFPLFFLRFVYIDSIKICGNQRQQRVSELSFIPVRTTTPFRPPITGRFLQK